MTRYGYVVILILYLFVLVSAAALSVEFDVGAIYKQSAGTAAAVQNLLCTDLLLTHYDLLLTYYELLSG